MRRTVLVLGTQIGLAVALVVLALVGVALVVVLRGQDAAAMQLVTATVSRADDVTDPPAGAWLAIRTPDRVVATPGIPTGFPQTSSMEEVARTGRPVTSTVDAHGTQYLVYTAARDQAVVQGVLDLSSARAERDRLVEALLLAGAVGLALAAAAGALLAGRAMRPVAAALALQRRFVADASHELRTPLTLLSTRAQLVQRDLRRHVDPQVVEAEIDGLVEDANNLADVLEDLLLAADPRGETLDEPVDLTALAARVAAAGRPSAVAGGVQVRCEPAAENAPDHVIVTASPGALRRAITALVDNAVRHARSEVTVAVGTRGSMAVVAVSDDGPGIDPQMLPRLFDRFESSGNPSGPRRTYGLGLALVSEVASRHHGTVTARNRPTGGDQPGGEPAASAAGATLELALPRAT
jgi:two-component system, OmpR family, sensor kinase